MIRNPARILFAGLFGLLLIAPLECEAWPKRSKYEAPAGFAGKEWGVLRRDFERLPEEPIGVGAGFILPVKKQAAFSCVPGRPGGGAMSGAVDGCDFQATLLRIRDHYEGGGFYVLSEYLIPGQGFRMGSGQDGVVIHEAVYQFCANWTGSVRKKEAPPDFDDINRFCGMRLQFQSETREELARLPGNHVPVYDRMLAQLIARHGEPAGYLRRGRVLIETEEGSSSNEAERKFSIWRWCPAGGNGLHTECDASVVLSINPVSGLGTLLYSTPLLWEYAYARDTNKKGDRLYKLLHAKQ